MKSTTARDVMSPDVKSVKDDVTLQEVAAFLTAEGISGAPVVDDSGEFVGVVSLTDLAVGAAEGSDRLEPEWSEGPSADLPLTAVNDGRLLARNVMTQAVCSIEEDQSVSEVARAMIREEIHRLFVTRNKRIVGVITTFDLLKLLGGE